MLEKDPYYDRWGYLHDVCFFCGLEECQEDHIHERIIYEHELHKECAHRLAVDGLLPDHSKMYRQRRKELLDWFEERRRALLAEGYAMKKRPGHPKADTLTPEILLALRPEQMGYYEHTLKITFVAKRGRLPDKDAWNLAMKEARKAQRRMESNAWLDKIIKKGSLLPI